jgi:predicted nucleic acid-binding protein
MATIRIYLDTSVYLKYFKEEEGSDTVNRVIRIAKKSVSVRIFMSFWTINECVTAIDKNFYQKKLVTNEQRDKILATILATSMKFMQTYPNIQFVPVTSKIIKDSTSLIHSLHISADDALHVYTAMKQRCKYFIFQDRHLRDRVTNNIRGMTMVDVTNANTIKNLFDDISKYERFTVEEWRDRSKKGEVCAVIACLNPSKNRCPTCFLHYCYQHVKSHFHRTTDQEIKQPKKEKQTLK